MLSLLAQYTSKIQKTILDSSYYDYTLLSKKQLQIILEHYIDLSQKTLKQVSIYETLFKNYFGSHK